MKKKQNENEIAEIKDPNLKTVIDRIDVKINLSNHAQEIAKEIHNEISSKQTQSEQVWLPVCPMPTDMCRVSPFFPIARQKLKERQYIEDLLITTSSWGEIKYSGPELSVSEEDVLMAILALLDSIKNRQAIEVEGKKTYTYKGPLLPILKLIGYKNRPGKKEYERIISSLKRMHSAVIELVVYKHSSKGKKKLLRRNISNMFSMADWNEENKELVVTVNPYFYECYATGSITLLDIIKRSKLKSPISKALYRFVQSHKGAEWIGHFLTLASTLNLDRNQPDKEIKRYIKRATNELIKNKILTSESGFTTKTKDVIRLVRSSSTMSRRKVTKIKG